MKVAVYIGRFQPFHYGHKAIIDYLLSNEYLPYILIGTSNSTSTHNPISDYIVAQDFKYSYHWNYLYDRPTNSEWLIEMGYTLDRFKERHPAAEFHLVIHNKPSEAGKYGLNPDQFISDFILENSSMFTGSIDLSTLDTPQINATDIRNTMSDLLKLAPKQSLINLLSAM